MEKESGHKGKNISTERLASIIKAIAREKNLGETTQWTQKSILKFYSKS